ncbi:ABC transporter substrate-binding protein [Actinotignum schaalii]
MKRRVMTVALSALCAGLLASCSASSTSTESPTSSSGSSAAASSASPAANDAASGPLTVTDQRDHQVEVNRPVQKIASAVIPAPTIIAAVDGSWDRIVGINESLLVANKQGIISKIFPASVTTPVIADRQFTPNMETILAQDPDVFIQWGDRSEDLITPIESAGIPVLGLKYGTQENLETWIKLFGEILGKEERAAQLIDYMHSEQDSISKQVAALGKPKPRGLQLSYSAEKMSANTEKSYGQHVFDVAGIQNMATSDVVQDGIVSPEQILAWDPEIIFLSAFDKAVPDDLYNDPRLSEVSAIKNKRVYRAPLGVYRWQVPCAESPLYWNYVAALAYPGEFKVDMSALMREKTKWIYNYDLTDEDIDLVLRTDINNGSANYDVVR